MPPLDLINSMSRDMKRNVRAELHFQHNTPTLWNLVLGECCVGAQTLHSSLGFFVLISYFFKTTNYYAKLI